METKCDGNWLDEFGACKICNGEIPQGPMNHCDLWKLERELAIAKHALEQIVQKRLCPMSKVVTPSEIVSVLVCAEEALAKLK